MGVALARGTDINEALAKADRALLFVPAFLMALWLFWLARLTPQPLQRAGGSGESVQSDSEQESFAARVYNGWRCGVPSAHTFSGGGWGHASVPLVDVTGQL